MVWETVRQAFVLINSEPGAEATVLKALEAISEVKEAHMIYGVYDIIAQVCSRAHNYLIGLRVCTKIGCVYV